MKNSRIKETIQDCLRNRNFMIGLIMILSVCLIAIFANEISPYSYTKQAVGGRMVHPSAKFLFGTDELGRDVFPERYLVRELRCGSHS